MATPSGQAAGPYPGGRGIDGGRVPVVVEAGQRACPRCAGHPTAGENASESGIKRSVSHSDRIPSISRCTARKLKTPSNTAEYYIRAQWLSKVHSELFQNVDKDFATIISKHKYLDSL